MSLGSMMSGVTAHALTPEQAASKALLNTAQVLQVELTGPSAARPGTRTSWTIKVKNTGPQDLERVHIDLNISRGTGKLFTNSEVATQPGIARVQWDLDRLPKGGDFQDRIEFVADSSETLRVATLRVDTAYNWGNENYIDGQNLTRDLELLA
ncbi:hypothetical protein ACWEQ8_07465 [Streptomyces noursei]